MRKTYLYKFLDKTLTLYSSVDVKIRFEKFLKISTLRLKEHQERRVGKILKDRRRACLLPDFFFL